MTEIKNIKLEGDLSYKYFPDPRIMEISEEVKNSVNSSFLAYLYRSDFYLSPNVLLRKNEL